MNEKVNEINLKLNERITKTLDNLKAEYGALRAGKANARILDKVTVESYGINTPLNQLSNISASDSRTLVISSWDKSMLPKIEKAILSANIGIAPTNDGNLIRLTFPIMTEERRGELVKQVKKYGEEAKIAIRNIRRDTFEAIKKLKTDKLISEDELTQGEKEAEKIVLKHIETVDRIEQEKAKEIIVV
jgi:ribosome recycling factor